MPKNLSVNNIKPTGLADNIKSSFGAVLDVKSKNLKSIGEEAIYLENVTISKGEPIGLLLSLNYPTTLTFQITRI